MKTRRPPPEPTRILLLEDSTADSDLIRAELNRAGMWYEMRVVRTRREFEEIVAAYTPSIALSDYSMPAFDGLSAFRIFNAVHPEVPFVIVSGTVGEENAIELIRSGITDYVIKDKLFTLASKIERALDAAAETKRKRLEQEKVRMQHEKLLEIAAMQSHQVRGPVATIIGLINLIEMDKITYARNAEVIVRLRSAASQLDDVIREIVNKTNEITRLES